MKTWKKLTAWCNRFLSKRFASVYSRRCYRGIDDLPIFYWNKIQEEKNLGYLVKTPTPLIRSRQPGIFKRYCLSAIWADIMGQYVKRFGFSDTFLDILRKQRDIALLKVERIVTSDPSREALIEIAEMELAELVKAGDIRSGSFWEMKASIESGMGFHINPMTTTVAEFYTYFRVLEERAKSQKVKSGANG